jgi:probable rRNA maturation factor
MYAITFHASTGRSYLPYLRRMLVRALPLVRYCPVDLSVALVGDVRMSALHQQFLNITGPTDVLTFDLEHNARARCISGEIVICVPYAGRTARRMGHDIKHELLLYALHGVLHLSGYDDRTPAAYQRMHRREDQILTRLGVGAVFKAQ